MVLAAALENGKGVGVGVAFIRLVRLAGYGLPGAAVKRREPCITVEFGIDFGDIETIGMRQQQGINFSTAHDHNFCGIRCGRGGAIQIVDNGAPVNVQILLPAEDQVGATG